MSVRIEALGPGHRPLLTGFQNQHPSLVEYLKISGADVDEQARAVLVPTLWGVLLALAPGRAGAALSCRVTRRTTPHRSPKTGYRRLQSRQRSRGAVYVTMDDAGTRSLAQADPARFVRGRPGLLAIDEVQGGPSLLLGTKAPVDAGATPESFASPGTAQGADGPSSEGFVVGELVRQTAWSRAQPRVDHFRDRNGLEVDVVLDSDRGDVVGIEVKSSGTVTATDATGLRFLRDKLGPRFRFGAILHAGPQTVSWGDRISAVPMEAPWTR